jgi:hypothetical protein
MNHDLAKVTFSGCGVFEFSHTPYRTP